MRYAFAEYELDDTEGVLGTGTLTRCGVPVHTRRKVLALITLLLRHRQRAVDRHELVARLWPDVRVGESSLSTVLNEARALLGDSGSRQELIRTLPGRGYRFVAEVKLTSGAAARIGPAECERRLDEALVGRTDALSAVEDALRALGRGEVQHLLVRGPLGIGRTRIAREVSSMASARGFGVHAGRCEPVGDAPPLWAFSQVLASLIAAPARNVCEGFASGDTGELRSLACDAPLPGAAARAGIGLAVQQLRFRRFEAIRRCLRAAGRHRPELVVIEDLHFADTTTLLCLRHLIRAGSSGRVMIVATLREGPTTGDTESLRHLADLAADPHLRSVPLAPLSRSETFELALHGGYDAIDEARLSALHQRAAGNPLFLRELLRAGHSEPDARALLTDESIAPSALLRARLDRLMLESLATPSRALLRDASALRGEIPLALLAALARRSRRRTLELLEPIERMQLLAPRAIEENVWVWAQPLVAEALHASIGPVERARLQCRIARAKTKLLANVREEAGASANGPSAAPDRSGQPAPPPHSEGLPPLGDAS